MYYFDVLAYKHFTADDQQSMDNYVLTSLDTIQYQSYAVIKEYGSKGDSPHLNIIYEVIKESQGKSFSQNVKRYAKKLNKDYLSKYMYRHKTINSQEGLANVICGYLDKESNSQKDDVQQTFVKEREILKIHKIDVEKLEPLREIKKFTPTHKIEKIYKADLFNLYYNYYKNFYDGTQFTPRLFTDMTYEIMLTHDLFSMGNKKYLRDVYINLEITITKHMTQNFREEMRMILMDII